MMKCDMCYDRTSVGKKPMCASVCPSQALFYGTREEIERLRPSSTAISSFQFGRQTINTRVRMMVPRADSHLQSTLSVSDGLGDAGLGHEVADDVFADIAFAGEGL